MKKQTKSRVFLIALFFVFFGPLFFATWLYFGSNTWLISSAQSHGELIQPPRPLNDFQITSINGDVLGRENFSGKWTLLYLGTSQCDLYCEASLFKMRQVRLALGRDRKRIQRIYLGVDKKSDSKNIQDVLVNYPHLQVVWFTEEQLYNQLPQLRDLKDQEIIVIDPLGNLMLRYTTHATSKGMKKDLKRLLKLSKIG